MRFHTFVLSALSGVALLGAAVAQTVTTEDGQPVIQGYGNFFRYRIDGLDPSLYDTPVVKVTQPRKFYIGEKAELTYSVQGGNRPYTFSLIGPPLPQGLTFDPRQGNFAGTSRTATQDSYVLAVQDAKGRVAKSDPFVVSWLDDFDESQHRTYPVQAFVGGTELPSPQPIFDGSATTDVVASGFGATVAVKFDRQIRAKTAVVAFSTEASFGACSYDLEAKDAETSEWKAVHRAQSLSSGGVLQAFNLMPSPRSGFVSDEWRVKLTNSCRMRVSELRIASAAPNPPPAWQTPEGLLVSVGPVPLGVSVVAPKQSPYSGAETAFQLADGSTLPTGFALKANGELTGPDGEGFPYGRVDFRLRATDGIGYWTERDYYLTPDAVPARTVYPAKVSVGGGADIRRAMNDGVTGAGADSVQVSAGGAILFDYGRFVHVGGGTVLAGDQVGSFVLEAEAGPDSWVAPSQVAGIAKRWRLVNEGTSASTVTEARLDAADYNHPPEWKTAPGPWLVGDANLTRPGSEGSGGVAIPAIVVNSLRLPAEAISQTIYSNAPATIALAPDAQVPAGMQFDGSAMVVERGADLPAGRLSVKLRAVDALGYFSDSSFVFNPASVRARTVRPSIAGPGGSDVTLLMNDGLTDASTKLTTGQSLVWSFGSFVSVAAEPVVSADNAAALVVEAETASGWVAPATVDGIAKRWRVRATAAVNVSEFRLDGAPSIAPPSFTPGAGMRTVDQNGIDGGSDLRLAVSAASRNPYASATPTISTVGSLPAGFSWSGSEIVVPKGESFPSGRVAFDLKAIDATGLETGVSYLFRPASVRAATIAPQVRDASGADAYFTLYDGAADRVVHLETGEAATFTFPRYVLVAAANVVDATDATKIVFEAQSASGWVAPASVDGIAKVFRVRATGPVDLREFRIDGAAAPGAPNWQTASGPYSVDEAKVAGQTGLAFKVTAEVKNILADPQAIYAAQGQLPAGFSFSVSTATITVPQGSLFAAGRQSVTVRASDTTGFFADRTFSFNPASVPAQPIKPDVRDPEGADVFGALSDGSTATGLALADGKSVVLDYGSGYVSAQRAAVVTATGGSVVIEAATTDGWVPAASADWIAKRFRVRAVGDVFLSEARLDGLPAQSAPTWNVGWSQTVTVSSPMYVTFTATPRSSFASPSAIAYSAPDGLPTGFTLSSGRLDVPTGESLPAGFTAVRLRAADSTGVYSDVTVPLQPDAPRALDTRSTIVAPDGSNVYDIMTDGAPVATAAGVDLAVGQAVVLDYGRYVYISNANTIEGAGTYVLEAETASGWVASNTVNSRAKRFRVKATTAGKLREVRLDGLEVQGPPTWNTAGTLRTIDQSGLSLQLSASLHSRYGAPLAYAATSALPSGFTLTSAGLLTVPPGESFPTGAVSFVVRATDAVAGYADQTFAFAPATVRAATVAPDSVVDPVGGNAVQTLYDDVKGTSAPGVALTSGQSIVWTFPRYVKVVPSSSIVDATTPAALVVETDGGTAGWVATTSLDTGKRFRIRATAAVTVREYRLDGGAVYLPPAWTTTGGSRTVAATGISGTSPASLSMQLQATNRSLRSSDPITFQIAPGSAALPAGFALTSAGLLTVPSAPSFPAGTVSFTVRAADTMGSGTDMTFTFVPEVVAMTAQLPSSVVAPDGSDVFKALYSGQNDVPVVLAPGEAIVWVFPRFVSPTQASVYAASTAGQFAVLETPAQDGSWATVHTASSSTGGAAVTTSAGYGRTYRLRNNTVSSQTVTTARLGGVTSLAPVWSSPNGAPYFVSQTQVVYGSVGNPGLSVTFAGSASASSGSTGVSFALASGTTLPSGFSLASNGVLTVPPGESFPAGVVAIPVRMSDTNGFYADRTFTFVPNYTAAASTYPSAVTGPDGADLFTPLYDGRIDRTVAIPAGGAVTFTYPTYVSVSSAAAFAMPTNGSANNNLVLQTRLSSGGWGTVQNYAVVSGSNLSITANVGLYANIGHEFRLLNSGSTGDVVVSEFRLDNAASLEPKIATAAGPWEVNQAQVIGASPAALSLQLAATKTYSGSTTDFAFAMAPGAKALPNNFGLSSSGLFVVPQGEQFPVGYVETTIRATDSRGFSTDKGFAFYPSSLRAADVIPDTVLDAQGNDVYGILYDGSAAQSVSLASNASITFTFPRFVRLTTISGANTGSGGPLYLERQLQDGSWSVVETKPVSGSPGLSSSINYVSTSKVYRLRNASAAAVPVSEYRLDQSPVRTPAWSTSTGPYFVSETIVSTTSGGAAVVGSNGLSLSVSASSQSSSAAITYSAVPGKTLPDGFAVSSNGTITVAPASGMQTGRVDVAVRATDGHGLASDQIFSFVPSGAVRANSLPPVAVTGPAGENLLPVLYDGRNDTAILLKAGEAISYNWDRFVQIATADFFAGSAGTNGIYLYQLQSLQSDGSWKNIGGLSYSNGTYNPFVPAVADQFGKSFRIVNTSTVTNSLAEVRLDSGPSYGVVIATSAVNRTVDTAISGTNPASLSMQLAATTAHPASTGASWTLRGAMPIGFTLASDGTLTVPAGADFPFGYVSFPVRATDNLGFTGDASFAFIPASVRAKGVLPQSVTGPNGENLFRAMYDGSTSTGIALATNQSITYTFDRFVSFSELTRLTLSSGTNYLVIETPNQTGGWNQASWAQNWNGSSAAGGFSLNGNFYVSKIFRVRNGSANTINVYDLPFDGSDYLGPTITTANGVRTVSETTIDNASPASLTVPMAATDNYTGAGTLTWSLTGTPPAGFTISTDGILSVPQGTSLPYGYNAVTVRATDQGGFYQDKAFTFRPASVAASTVAPVSVTGPSGQDLSIGLYDGVNANVLVLANDASVTFTFDRYVNVTNLTVGQDGYYAETNFRLALEIPNQNGGWNYAGQLYRYNNGTAQQSGVTDISNNTSKVFRLRNIYGSSFFVSELRLDNPASYAVKQTVSSTARVVNQSGISGVSPAGFGLQLAATSGYPAGGAISWDLATAIPDGFSISSTGLVTVPAGADFPLGYVSVPARATDAKGFSTTVNYPFYPDAVRANTVAPVSVTGPNGEDLLSTLYDGSSGTSYVLASNKAITFTFDRFVKIQDLSLANGAYTSSGAANQNFYIQIPNQAGGWNNAAYFVTNSAGQSASLNVWDATQLQSKVFRLLNSTSSSMTAAEMRLDNPAAYGLTWTQTAGTFYVSDTTISGTNGGAAFAGTTGLSIALTATSGHPAATGVNYSWAPGFTPPDGFTLSGSTITVPASSAFATGTVSLQIRATDSRGFASMDRAFSFVPMSVRANTVSPASIVDGSGQDVRTALYDDDASSSTTVAATIAAGQSVTWTFPQWTSIAANATVVASGSPSTTLVLERPLQDGTWQAAESRNMFTGVASLQTVGAGAPSKVWRLRNSGAVAASLIEWRVDGTPSYVPVLTTALTTRYVATDRIVDTAGGTTASSGTSGLVLTLAGTVSSPGGGSLSYAWAPGFTPPSGFSLAASGDLTVPARESMPTGQVLLSIRITDPRGFGITRVATFAADSVSAKTQLASATVVGPSGASVASALVDGSNTAAVTLQAGEAVTWTFPRYVTLNEAARSSLSATTWQLEIPNQAGGWSAVETSTGLLSTASARTSRIYRLRNIGTAAITVGEYAIDNFPAVGATTAWNPGDMSTNSAVLNDGLDSYCTSGNWNRIRGYGGKTTGKWYFESTSSSNDVEIGLAGGNVPLTGGTAISSHADAIAIYSVYGWVRKGGSTQATYANWVNQRVMIAYDADAGRVWFGMNGTWTGNPVAGTGGFAFKPSSAVYPAGGSAFSGTTHLLKLISKSTAYSPPAGFSVWSQ